MQCKNCGKEIPQDANYCPFCTQKMEREESKLCESCGKEIPIDAVYCPYCAVELNIVLQSSDAAEVNLCPSAPEEDNGNIADEDNLSQSPEENVPDLKPSKSKKKPILIAVIVAVLLLLGVGGYFIFFRLTPLQVISKTVEASSNISELSIIKYDAEKYTVSIIESNFISDVPGAYKITYELTNNKSSQKKQVVFGFEVKDTMAPEIIVEDSIKSFLGFNFDALDYVTVKDNAANLDKEKIVVEGNVDINTEGSYPIKISIADAAGNKAEKNISVTVKQLTADDKFVKNIEAFYYDIFKDGLPAAIYCLNDQLWSDYEPAVIQGTLETMVPGVYLIEYKMTNRSTSNTLTVNYEYHVIDTTAPIISAPDIFSVYVGQQFVVTDYISVEDNSLVNKRTRLVIDEENSTVEGIIDTSVVGTYPIKFTIQDFYGNIATKNVDVIVHEMTDTDKFFEKIKGYWHVGRWVLEFSMKEGQYFLKTYNFPSDSNEAGSFEFIDFNEDMTEATLSWNWVFSSEGRQFGSNKTSTINIDTGAPGDNKMIVDLNDGKGPHEYQFTDDRNKLYNEQSIY